MVKLKDIIFFFNYDQNYVKYILKLWFFIMVLSVKNVRTKRKRRYFISFLRFSSFKSLSKLFELKKKTFCLYLKFIERNNVNALNLILPSLDFVKQIISQDFFILNNTIHLQLCHAICDWDNFKLLVPN